MAIVLGPVDFPSLEDCKSLSTTVAVTALSLAALPQLSTIDIKCPTVITKDLSSQDDGDADSGFASAEEEDTVIIEELPSPISDKQQQHSCLYCRDVSFPLFFVIFAFSNYFTPRYSMSDLLYHYIASYFLFIYSQLTSSCRLLIKQASANIETDIAMSYQSYQQKDRFNVCCTSCQQSMVFRRGSCR